MIAMIGYKIVLVLNDLEKSIQKLHCVFKMKNIFHNYIKMVDIKKLI